MHTPRHRPVCLGKLPALGAAATPSESTQQPRHSAKPSSAAGAPSSSSMSPEAPTAPMSPVNGELVNKLDSKTAKNGDSVVVQTKTSVKTPDGTEIPKGSKLVGHVIAAQPSQPGQNSQLALQFDRVELKGGKTMPVHSQIQSISPPERGSIGQRVSPAQAAGSSNGRRVGSRRGRRRGAKLRAAPPACFRRQRWSRAGDGRSQNRTDSDTHHVDPRGLGREQRTRATRSQDG